MPGFDPWTFGSKVQSLTSCATATARIDLPKLRVVLALLCFFDFSYGLWYFILCPYFLSSYHYEIWHTCRSHHRKMFGVLILIIFGQA